MLVACYAQNGVLPQKEVLLVQEGVLRPVQAHALGHSPGVLRSLALPPQPACNALN